MKKEELIQKFQELYGAEGDIRTYFAPGRVNLIGEHTDYNGGHVFPCALTIGTYAVARKRTDRKLRFFSVNFERLGIIESSLDDLVPSRSAGWTNYPEGVMWTFGKRGMEISNGVDILLYGNIPNGSGLSSSASVEVVTGVMLRDLFGFDSLTNIDLALIGQQSENEYNGVNCGIMDQFAVAMGKKDYAIFLDTSDLSYTYAPIKLEHAKNRHRLQQQEARAWAIPNTTSAAAQCEAALAELQKVVDIKSLGDLTEEAFRGSTRMPSRMRPGKQRAKHAVYENQRTIQAVAALEVNDIAKFGQLMNASHVSLRDDYRGDRQRTGYAGGRGVEVSRVSSVPA